jgi:hypothetical protein
MNCAFDTTLLHKPKRLPVKAKLFFFLLQVLCFSVFFKNEALKSGRKDCTGQNFHFHSRFTLLGHGDLDACFRGKALYIWNMVRFRSTLWDERRRG